MTVEDNNTTLETSVNVNNTTVTSEANVSHGRISLVQPHDNPFTADGELSHKADYIIRHSKISRTEIRIVDPDSPQPPAEEEIVQQEMITAQHAAPPTASAPSGNKTNGQVEDKASPNDVKVDVPKGDAKERKPEKQTKTKTCKCCSIM
jgi:hypothetical protein